MNWRHKFKEIFSVDLRVLAVFRISIGLALLINLLDRAREMVHYTDEILPVSLVKQSYISQGNFSFHVFSGNLIFQAFLFFIAMILALMVIFGAYTRISVFLSWVFFLSLMNRNPWFVFGADVLLVMMLFWAIFLPLGSKFSFDSLKKKSKNSKFFSWAVVGAMLQVGLMYFFSAIWKLFSGPEWFPNGNGIFLSLQTFFGLPSSDFLFMFPLVLKIFSLIIPFFEIAVIFLFFSPIYTDKTRIIAIVLFSIFHISLSLFLNLGVFVFICIASLTLFLPENLLFRSKKSILLEDKGSISVFLSYFFIFIIFLSFLANLQSFGVAANPSPFKPILNLFAINQKWDTFGSTLSRNQSSFYFSLTLWSGRLKSGHTVYAPNYHSLTVIPPTYDELRSSSNRWIEFKLFTENSNYRTYYAAYLCRKWNSDHPVNQSLINIQEEFIPINKKGFSRRISFRFNCTQA